MLEILGALLLIFLIALSIGLHEVGHLVPAKRFGVKVTEFAIGFGPALWKGQWGETSLRLRAFPVGGFIRMIGMYAPSRADGKRVGGWFAQQVLDAREASAEEIGADEDSRTFYRLSTPKRLVVMIGGPAMNLLLAAVLFALCFSVIGFEVPTNGVGQLSSCVPTIQDPDATRENCQPTPAKAAGIKAGDQIVGVDGVAVSDWVGFRDALADVKPGDEVSLRLLDSTGSERTVVLVAADWAYEELDAKGKPTGVIGHRAFIGVSPAFEFQTMSLTTVPGAMWDMTTASVAALGAFPQKLVELAVSLATGQERDPMGPVSVVGVTRLGGEIAAADASWRTKAFDLLGMAASLNLFLFLFNLLPLLPLDGGHAAGAIFESLRRRVASWRGRPDPGPVDIARLLPLTYVTTFLLLGSGVLVILADIVAPISLNS